MLIVYNNLYTFSDTRGRTLYIDEVLKTPMRQNRNLSP